MGSTGNFSSRGQEYANLERIWDDFSNGIDELYRQENMLKGRFFKLYQYPLIEVKVGYNHLRVADDS